MENLNFILEQVNGVISLLTLSLLGFLTFYLWDWLNYRRTTPARAIARGLPLAIALASLLLLDKLGTLVVRATVWSWRTSTEGKVPFTETETIFLLLGASIISASLLLLVRLLTRPRFGDWPWVASPVVAAVYVVLTTLFRLT